MEICRGRGPSIASHRHSSDDPSPGNDVLLCLNCVRELMDGTFAIHDVFSPVSALYSSRDTSQSSVFQIRQNFRKDALRAEAPKRSWIDNLFTHRSSSFTPYLLYFSMDGRRRFSLADERDIFQRMRPLVLSRIDTTIVLVF